MSKTCGVVRDKVQEAREVAAIVDCPGDPVILIRRQHTALVTLVAELDRLQAELYQVRRDLAKRNGQPTNLD